MSQPMSEVQDRFSLSFDRPLSRWQTLQSRASSRISVDTGLQGTACPLTEEVCVGKYGNQESDYGGNINVRTLELFSDNTCQWSNECHKSAEGPSLEAEWLDGSWGIDGEGRLVLEGVEDDQAVVIHMLPIGDGPTRPPIGFEQENVD